MFLAWEASVLLCVLYIVLQHWHPKAELKFPFQSSRQGFDILTEFRKTDLNKSS